MERRAFLGAIASPALIGLPAAEGIDSVYTPRSSVELNPLPPEPPTYFYCSMERFADRKPQPVNIHGTPGGKQSRRRRYVFEPLDTDRRFRTIKSEWRAPYPDWSRTTDLPQEERMVEWDQWRDQCYELGFPPSLLSLPPGVEAGPEYDSDDCELLTREEAIAEVAAENRRTAENGLRSYPGTPWLIAVEIGKPAFCSVLTFDLEENGVGCLHERATYPIRIVQPTAAELASEQVDWTVTDKAEGGAA